jgi:3,4-dihydroxy 2-butanone 4-phosphate synthase/GTP cyclohydrolase II
MKKTKKTGKKSRGKARRAPASKSRGKNEAHAKIVAKANLPTTFGRFTIFGIRGARPGEEAVAIQHGRIAAQAGAGTNGAGGANTSRGGETNSRGGETGARGRGKAPLVRVHSQCLTGDVFTSQRCDCRAQLEFSLRKIAKEPSGVVLYMPQEGRGIGLINKLKAYQLQDGGLDTVEANRRLGFAADSRDYDFAAQALKALGLTSVRLLSNNPDKVEQLERAGIHVAERVPCRPRTSHHSRAYLKTKKQKMGHILAGL